jgi:anti-sigma factor RsiW
MSDHNLPVTEDELNAYVDGELPADRRAAVEAWLATHADDAARVAHWRAMAEMIRARYGAVATEPVPARLALDQLDRSDRSWKRVAAAAVVAAFFVGAAAGWFGHGAAASAPSAWDTLATEALDAHKLYVVEVRHPVEVPASEANHLVQWLSKRVGYSLRAPNLESIGLKLVGGRLLPGPTGEAAAFFMYEGASGERYTIYCTRTQANATALRYSAAGPVAATYWVDGGVAYVVSGSADRDRLQKIAENAYMQLDNRTQPGSGRS